MLFSNLELLQNDVIVASQCLQQCLLRELDKVLPFCWLGRCPNCVQKEGQWEEKNAISPRSNNGPTKLLANLDLSRPQSSHEFKFVLFWPSSLLQVSLPFDPLGWGLTQWERLPQKIYSLYLFYLPSKIFIEKFDSSTNLKSLPRFAGVWFLPIK